MHMKISLKVSCVATKSSYFDPSHSDMRFRLQVGRNILYPVAYAVQGFTHLLKTGLWCLLTKAVALLYKSENGLRTPFAPFCSTCV